MTIGERFLLYRAKENLTQKQLADMLGVGVHTVQRAEQGKSKMHKAHELRIEQLFDDLTKGKE